MAFLIGNFASILGLREAEIIALLQKLAVENIDTHLSTIRDWYNGYNWYDEAHHNWPLYNPWSVMNYLHALHSGEPAPAQAYWCESGGGELIRHSLLHCENAVKAQFSQLLQPELSTQTPLELAFHKQVSLSDLQHAKGFWSLLFHSGYITPHGPMRYQGNALHCHAIVPNFEVLDAFRGLLERAVWDLQANELITNDFVHALLQPGRYPRV